MSHKTKAELSLSVGRRLKIADALNSLAAEDAAFIEDEYDTLYAMWFDRDYVYWANTTRTAEEIPAKVFQALVDIMAGHCATGFGKDEPTVADETGSTMLISARGWRNLRRHVRTPAGGFSTPAKYF